MKTELVQTVFFAFALVLAAAAQDMMPAFGGAKPPFLLIVALCAAMRPDPEPAQGSSNSRNKVRHVGWLVVALAAGAFADALDTLPFGCMAAFTAFACAAVRLARNATSGMPPALAGLMIGAVAAPCQEAWLNLWLPFGSESALVRFFASAPAAAVAGAAIFATAPWVARTIGLEGKHPAERRVRR